MLNKKSRRTHLDTKRLIALAALMGLMLSIVPFASAQDATSGLLLRAHPAFDGYFKYGEWLPVWIELENDGPDVDAEVRVQVSSSGGTTNYIVPVLLPTVSRKRLPLYVLPNNFTRELNVQVVVGDQLLASQKISLDPQQPIGYFVGLMAAERGALSLINAVELPGQTRPITLIDIPLADLPERPEGLGSFDTLIVNDVDTSTLTPEGVIALENWVNQGGRLVIGGGAGAQRTVAGLPESLLPLIPSGGVELSSLPGLENFGESQEIRVPGPFIVTTGEIQDSLVLASQDGIPLVLERPIGDGSVNYVALDLSSSPFDAWSGTTTFWEKLLSPGGAYPEWLPPDVSARQQLAGQMPYALSNLPMLDLPSVQGLALLLGLYIIVVGPINYLVLRRRNRLHWAWITIPVITTIFSAGAFGLGYVLHGTDVFLNKISVINLHPSGKAYVNSYMGLFSPGQQAYEIEASDGGLLSPLTDSYYDPWRGPSGLVSSQEMTFIQGDPGYVRGLTVNQWSMQSFMSEGMILEFGQIATDLRVENDALAGALRNESSYKLTDVVILLGKRLARLHDLEPGEETQVNLDLSGLTDMRFGPPISYLLLEDQFNNPGPSGPSRQTEMKRIILESVFERGASFESIIGIGPSANLSLSQGPVLIGWLDQAPPEVKISGQKPAQQTTALVYMPISYKLSEQEWISLPIGMIPGALTRLPQAGGICGETGSTSVYIDRGEAQFEFLVPVGVRDIQVENLKLSLWSDGGWWISPKVAIYDWQVESWRDIAEPAQGANLVPDASSLMRSDGLVQISLSSEGNSQGCYYLALGLEGWQK